MNPASSSTASHIIITCSKVADIVVFALLVIFFFGFLAFDYELLGLHKPIITIPNETEQYFEAIPWILFGVLVFDIYLKYIIVGRDLKLLFKYHWLDISMTALIPILLPLKFLKVTLKLFKAVKTTKFGYKLFQKVKKIFSHFSIFGRKID
ncbi:MAG TPA: hypothetical protein VFH25_05645 [Nitrososphaeraceae archaeon]|nr:hypothetical protein [Nitrososphaeraceae archaeon]